MNDAAQKPTMIAALSDDGALVEIEKLTAHRDGVLHLAVSAFVFDGDRLLIQRRAAGKYHSAGLWANTVCTHLHWDEGVFEHPAAAVARALKSELGLAPPPPLKRGRLYQYHAPVGGGLSEHERVHVFHAHVDRTQLPMTPAADEVAEIDWAPVSALREEAAGDAGRLAPWFTRYLLDWDALGLPKVGAPPP